ncbi:hypothetical protein [Rhizorhabdus histidinilytica]|uniref:hypothetical protein n=1 Tax=Rhizorhabdus histidinilytica TaxID=439228 RepID=UPI0032201FFF
MSRDEQARDNDVMIGDFIARWDDAADGVVMDADTAQALAREFKRMRELIYIPGVFQCAKCSFRLVQSNLNAQDGTVTARDVPGEKCPNDGSPMWRVTYRDDVSYSYDRWEEQVNRAVAAEKALEALRGASGGGVERTEAALHSAMVKASTNVELLDAPTPPDDKMLLRCPFCHGAMQFRKALWPSDGDSDAIIHAVLGGSNCPMGDFGNGTADESIISLWNTRIPDHPAENAKSSGDRAGAENAQVGDVERLARAIHDACGLCHGDDPDPFKPFTWEEAVADEYPVHAEHARTLARAALAVMPALSEVRAALEPFAKIAPMVEHTDKRDGDVVHRQGHQGIYLELTKDDFRRAASIYAALARSGKGEG